MLSLGHLHPHRAWQTAGINQGLLLGPGRPSWPVPTARPARLPRVFPESSSSHSQAEEQEAGVPREQTLRSPH